MWFRAGERTGRINYYAQDSFDDRESKISWIGGVLCHDYGCSLKAYRRESLADVHLYGEMHRFIRFTRRGQARGHGDSG